MSIYGSVSLTVQVVRDSGPLGRQIGNVTTINVADVAGEFDADIAAALLRGIANNLNPEQRHAG